jgi:hypothetical protein
VLLANLVRVLIRSREAPFSVSGDIEAIDVWSSSRTLARSKLPTVLVAETQQHRSAETHQMMVQVFGFISSPTSCLYALQHVANNHDKFRYVGGIIIKSFYVDNYIDSFDTEERSRAVLSLIPASEWVHQTPKLDLDGCLWDCQPDCFKIATCQPRIVRTKREMLAEIARMFDPLGFILPITT